MKTTIRTGLLAVALLLASPSWAIMLSLQPADQIAGTGDTVFLDLVASDLGDGIAPSLGAYDLDLVFDDSRLDFVGATFGDGLNDPLDPLTVLFQGVAAGVGTINLAEVSLLVTPAGDPTPLDLSQPDMFVIATLEFFVQDLEPGNSTMVDFGAFVTLFDGFGDPFVDFPVEPAVIRNPISEPFGLLVFGAGLIGMFAARRRR